MVTSTSIMTVVSPISTAQAHNFPSLGSQRTLLSTSSELCEKAAIHNSREISETNLRMLMVGDVSQQAKKHCQLPCGLARWELSMCLFSSHVELDEAILNLMFAV